MEERRRVKEIHSSMSPLYQVAYSDGERDGGARVFWYLKEEYKLKNYK